MLVHPASWLIITIIFSAGAIDRRDDYMSLLLQPHREIEQCARWFPPP